ncbi:hypothetical protein ACSNOI_37765 [Actinomadura kijaniata]|uniref:hypothetical protein n=1 Tax=Actinomadura kijaniata TaxID=46161 RepID=UPI003F1A4F2C
MSTEPQPAARAHEDVRFRTVGPAIESYPSDAEGPVDYLEVVSDRHGPLGYLWASSTQDAAGFVRRADGGDHAANESVAWVRDLRAARARGVPAGELLDFFARTPLPLDPDASHYGRVVPNPRSTASTLSVLRSIAGS